MNAFDAAKKKYEKNYERQHREKPAAPIEPASLAVVEAPKEKSKSDAAFIHVRIVLPDREMSFSFKKPCIHQNVVPSKLTQSEMKRCIEEGFRPLLGGLDESR